MKKTKIILVILLILIMSYNISQGCTSFAVYSANNIYGMNFDYPDTNILLKIHKMEDGKVFSMEFEHGTEYIPFAGMNSKGLFVAVQMLYPSELGKTELENNEIYIGELGALVGECETVGEIEEYIKNKKLVNMPITIHQLFADSFGNSMIVEVGDEENKVMKNSDNFMIMSNFSNYDHKDKPIDEITGAGADRYKTAYEYINENIDDFTLDSGWEVLKRTVQNSASYSTQCSMLFDSENGEVYIAIKSDFEKIWKVSLEDETIECIKGSDEPIELQIGSSGVLISDINNTSNISNTKDIVTTELDMAKETPEHVSALYWILSIGLIILIIIMIIIVITNKKYRSKKE